MKRLRQGLRVRRNILLVYIVCCAVWGSTWAVIKVGLADLPPFLFAGVRMSLACALLAPTLWRHRSRLPTSAEWRDVGLVGFSQIGLSYACIFAGERTLPSSLAAVLFATFPVWTSVLAHFALPGEPLTGGRIGASLLAFAGAAVIESPALLRWRDAASPAALFPLAAAIASAFGNVWLKKRIGHLPATLSLWGQTLVGGGFLLLLAAALERDTHPRWTAGALGSLAYLTLFGTLLTFVALFWLIPRVSISAIGLIPIFDTLLAVLLGVSFLGEAFNARIAAGAGLIVVAAVWVNRTSQGWKGSERGGDVAKSTTVSISTRAPL
jgi:drug/metabolite transporter (DMT)-like permease